MDDALEILRHMTWGEGPTRGDLCFTLQQLALLEPLLASDRRCYRCEELIEPRKELSFHLGCLSAYGAGFGATSPDRAAIAADELVEKCAREADWLSEGLRIAGAIRALAGRYKLADAPRPAGSSPPIGEHDREMEKTGIAEVPKENREQKATRLVRESGKTTHANDCATSCAPAEEPGPCDCHEVDLPTLDAPKGTK